MFLNFFVSHLTSALLWVRSLVPYFSRLIDRNGVVALSPPIDYINTNVFSFITVFQYIQIN